MDELDQINQFISFLAIEGVSDDGQFDVELFLSHKGSPIILESKFQIKALE